MQRLKFPPTATLNTSSGPGRADARHRTHAHVPAHTHPHAHANARADTSTQRPSHTLFPWARHHGRLRACSITRAPLPNAASTRDPREKRFERGRSGTAMRRCTSGGFRIRIKRRGSAVRCSRRMFAVLGPIFDVLERRLSPRTRGSGQNW